jgi:hypothetical protein
MNLEKCKFVGVSFEIFLVWFGLLLIFISFVFVFLHFYISKNLIIFININSTLLPL